MHERKTSFPPIVGGFPKVLILGSIPGEASLKRQQYYGHRRNAFWPIMMTLLRLPPDSSYAERTEALIAHGIALWDVIAECERKGSLDTAIQSPSIRTNDIAGLFARFPSIAVIAFNGGTAEREYRKRIACHLSPEHRSRPTKRLPSTSPAYAGMSIADKTAVWLEMLERYLV